MLHEKIVDSVDVAAVWPVSVQIAPVPIPDIEPEQASHAFAPMPATLVRALIVPVLLTFGAIVAGIAVAAIL